MGNKIVIIILCLIFIAFSAIANVYKCVSEDGVISFSDTPCADNAQVFLEIKKETPEQIISQAIPFKDISINSKSIESHLLDHGKKLGKSLFPDDQYHSYQIQSKPFRVQRYPEWDLRMHFGPPDNHRKWRISIQYRVKPVDGIKRIWIRDLYLFLWNQYHDLEQLNSVKSLTRIRKGHWRFEW